MNRLARSKRRLKEATEVLDRVHELWTVRLLRRLDRVERRVWKAFESSGWPKPVWMLEAIRDLIEIRDKLLSQLKGKE